MTKQKNSPQEKFREKITSRELLKTDIHNTSEQEFRITAIRLIAGLKESIEDSREYLSAEIKPKELVMMNFNKMP